MADLLKLMVAGLYLAKSPETFVTSPQAKLTFDWPGIVGDRRHYGVSKIAGVHEKPHPKGETVRNLRQFTAVTMYELELLAEQMGISHVYPEWIGANILFESSGPISELPPLTVLQLENGVALRLMGLNVPCAVAGRAIQENFPDVPDLAAAFVNQGLRLRGTCGWVDKIGDIRLGEMAAVHLPRSLPAAKPVRPDS